MNRLSSILPPERVLVSVDVTSKKRAFEEAGLLFESLHGLSRVVVTESLFARELVTMKRDVADLPAVEALGMRAPDTAQLTQLYQQYGFRSLLRSLKQEGR